MVSKLDLRKEFPEYYAPDPQPQVHRFGAVPYLCLEGQGKPGGADFQAAFQALFTVAYDVKFAAKAKGQDFTVPPPEAQWWADGERPLDKVAPSKFRWKLLLRVPATVRAGLVAAAKKAAVAKGIEGAAAVQLERINEGRCIQGLHVGLYDKEAKTLRLLQETAASLGLRLTGRHHEIYLNDPRRAGPAKTKTILRSPVAAA